MLMNIEEIAVIALKEGSSLRSKYPALASQLLFDHFDVHVITFTEHDSFERQALHVCAHVRGCASLLMSAPFSLPIIPNPFTLLPFYPSILLSSHADGTYAYYGDNTWKCGKPRDVYGTRVCTWLRSVPSAALVMLTM